MYAFRADLKAAKSNLDQPFSFQSNGAASSTLNECLNAYNVVCSKIVEDIGAVFNGVVGVDMFHHAWSLGIA